MAMYLSARESKVYSLAKSVPHKNQSPVTPSFHCGDFFDSTCDSFGEDRIFLEKMNFSIMSRAIFFENFWGVFSCKLGVVIFSRVMRFFWGIFPDTVLKRG
jgi:hypothetical protein